MRYPGETSHSSSRPVSAGSACVRVWVRACVCVCLCACSLALRSFSQRRTRCFLLGVREKSASSSADQYQRSWSRTGSAIDALCGADLSHSPRVTPSTGGEVAGPADPTGCREEPPTSKTIFWSLIKSLHLSVWACKYVQMVESCYYLFTF